MIDHHRKMVDHIDNAVIFYREAVLLLRFRNGGGAGAVHGRRRLSRLEAEALLAGIMLDTRSFVMKAGVRTFEAAAYLRRLGADTVEVKRLFAGSMDLYREKPISSPGATVPGHRYRLLRRARGLGTAHRCRPGGG